MKRAADKNQQSFNDVLPNCYACGQNIAGRWERISKGLCLTLIEFYQISKRFNREFLHLQKDCKFSINQNNNFQKLRYFSLIEQSPKAGFWRITWQGSHFLNGMAIQRKVLVFNNEVQARSEEKISISEVMKTEDKFWLKKDDFVAEMAAVEV